MESFSHEEFIRARRMEGKEVPITAEEALRRNDRSAVKIERTLKDRWEDALQREAADRELEVRKQRKKAQSELAAIQKQHRAPTIDEPHVLATAIPTATRCPPIEVLPQHQVRESTRSSPDNGKEIIVTDPPNGSVVTDPPKEGDVTNLPNGSEIDRSEEVTIGIVETMCAAHTHSKATFQSSKVQVELWWQGLVDLDLSCVLLDHNNRRCGLFFFGETNFVALHHSGDMLCAPKGASERISVDIGAVPPQVKNIYFVMTSFSSDSCDDVEMLFVHVVDGSNSKTILGSSKNIPGNTRAALLCRLTRNSSSFDVEVLDITFTHGDTVLSLVRDIENHACSM